MNCFKYRTKECRFVTFTKEEIRDQAMVSMRGIIVRGRKMDFTREMKFVPVTPGFSDDELRVCRNICYYSQ